MRICRVHQYKNWHMLRYIFFLKNIRCYFQVNIIAEMDSRQWISPDSNERLRFRVLICAFKCSFLGVPALKVLDVCWETSEKKKKMLKSNIKEYYCNIFGSRNYWLTRRITTRSEILERLLIKFDMNILSGMHGVYNKQSSTKK